MTRGLRRRHLLMWVPIGLVVGVGLIAAVGARTSVPTQDLTRFIPTPMIAPGGVAIDLEGSTARVSHQLAPDGETVFLDLVIENPVRLPDVGVYWNASTSYTAESVFLGSLTSASQSRFTLPTGANPSTGSLTFYSVAQRREIATAELRR